MHERACRTPPHLPGTGPSPTLCAHTPHALRRSWAESRVADAKYMNVGSGPQVQQLLFAGAPNKAASKDPLPLERVFKVGGAARARGPPAGGGFQGRRLLLRHARPCQSDARCATRAPPPCSPPRLPPPLPRCPMWTT